MIVIMSILDQYAIDRERRLENKILNTKGIFCIKYGQELNCRRVRKDT